MPQESYKPVTDVRNMKGSPPHMKVTKSFAVGREKKSKRLMVGEDDADDNDDNDENKRKVEGGTHRRLNLVKPKRNIQEKRLQQDQIFLQTNLSGIVMKSFPAVEIVPRTYVEAKDKKAKGKEISNHRKKMKIYRDLSGEMGTAVKLINPEEIKRSNEIFHLYQFNAVVSDKIALNRSLPDARPQRCKFYTYPADLPTTSIIIAFHNEAKSTLLRTIYSIVNRSPRHLITEIILVNDASNLGDWYQSSWFVGYLANFSIPVNLFHSEERKGLVGARMLGLSKVSNNSEVVTFLDSHCECTDGWLEPLLQRISKDRSRVVSPVVDAIDDQTFEYVSTHSWPHIGGFSWFPEFMWIRVPPEEKKRVYGDFSLPLRTPTISGGLFAIDIRFFRRLGFYDPGLKIWGGENLELSLKVWMCGGSLEIIPCSRVGHVFRGTTPYSFLGDPEHIFLRNNRRILDTWARNYSHVFYALTPKYRTVQYGSIEDRLSLKKSLKCNDFNWYLKHVYPGHILPQNYQHLGQIVNKKTGLCLDNSAVGEKKKLGSRITADSCQTDNMSQIVMLNSYDQLQHDRYCLTPQGEDNFVSLELCELGKTTNARRQEWSYNKENEHLIHARTKQCLTSSQKVTGTKQFLMIQNCSDRDAQIWILKSLPLIKTNS